MCTPSVLLTVCRCYEWADRSEEEESKDGQRSTPYTVARDDGGEPTSSTPPRTGDPEISLSHDYIATRFVCSMYPRPGAVRSVLLVGRAHVYSSGSIYRRLCVTTEDLDPLLVGRAHVYSSGSIYRRLCVTAENLDPLLVVHVLSCPAEHMRRQNNVCNSGRMYPPLINFCNYAAGPTRTETRLVHLACPTY
jgi:hypothetical protein